MGRERGAMPIGAGGYNSFCSSTERSKYWESVRAESVTVECQKYKSKPENSK